MLWHTNPAVTYRPPTSARSPPSAQAQFHLQTGNPGNAAECGRPAQQVPVTQPRHLARALRFLRPAFAQERRPDPDRTHLPLVAAWPRCRHRPTSPMPPRLPRHPAPPGNLRHCPSPLGECRPTRSGPPIPPAAGEVAFVRASTISGRAPRQALLPAWRACLPGCWLPRGRRAGRRRGCPAVLP